MALSSALGRLRWTAIAEGISYLLFALTMPLKYFMDIPGPNKVVGMAHGVLFMLYVLLVIQCAYLYKWSWKVTGIALLFYYSCGYLLRARQVFWGAAERSILSWSYFRVVGIIAYEGNTVGLIHTPPANK